MRLGVDQALLVPSSAAIVHVLLGMHATYDLDRHSTASVDTRCFTQPSLCSIQPRGLAAATSLTLSCLLDV